MSDGKRVFDKRSFKAVLNIPVTESGSSILKSLASHRLLQKSPLAQAANVFDLPIRFVTSDGQRLIGFEAEGLIEICKLLLKARELGLLRSTAELRYARAAESLLVSLANVGLAALIDEATGYQATRKRDALQALLDRYLKKELAAWAKRFPDEYYEQLFRLRRWKWQGRSVNPPQIVSKYTKNIVYERLAPGILKELESRNPMQECGERKAKHHQWLTDDVGHPALAQHLHAVVAIMRISADWHKFVINLQDAFPKKGDQLDLKLDDN
ncbi:P63C domain-containing protein [Granulicella sp. 5B5]|uniref:P63C domain-containing protein n=1 Tax=Granulicella sp. 5B5 TaxID=1617967 RepID=UPI001C710988|nr:P63C domain-containing protein [Granulicella sp. 5B5]